MKAGTKGTIILGIWGLAVAGIIVHANRYNLGLKKPNFRPGECIVWRHEGEFTHWEALEKVLKVGKTSYLLGPIDNGRLADDIWSFEYSIEYTDDNYTLVTYPAGV